MDGLFSRRGTKATDAIFRQLADPPTPEAQLARANASELWTRTSPYLERQLAERAARSFHQAFWEMYVASALLDLGLDLKRREVRRFANQGPDLQIQIGEVCMWVEAVAVTAGTGQDAVPKPVPGEIFDVPDDGIKLRLLSGLSEKRKKYLHYREKELMKAGEPYVVAINDAAVPCCSSDLWVPRIVSVLFPIGKPAVKLDTTTMGFVESFHLYQNTVSKKSGAAIPTTDFLSPESTGLSAILYGNADIFNLPLTPGSDFVLVHNPWAAAPLPRGTIRHGMEYWKSDEDLEGTRHE